MMLIVLIICNNDFHILIINDEMNNTMQSMKSFPLNRVISGNFRTLCA